MPVGVRTARHLYTSSDLPHQPTRNGFDHHRQVVVWRSPVLKKL
jgi:hypothetical protein